ncbi:9737_t:CDS:1, partial [Ambispora leptoticha]
TGCEELSTIKISLVPLPSDKPKIPTTDQMTPLSLSPNILNQEPVTSQMISPLLLPSNILTTNHISDEFNIDQTPLPLPPSLDLALFNERLEVHSSSIIFPNLITEHDSE